ncbi:MAG TPA: hypothetical protein VGP50_00665 [Stellaceae bacterium]|nr:hypothetical protein [Stellaceae bacterium]
MPQAPDCSTHFLFEHNVFKVDGGRFAFTADGTEPAFHIALGSLAAALRLPGLRKEFAIDAASTDGRLLRIVELSLRFVKEIRPGDSIPREILDGTASWSVSDGHRATARGRLIAHAVTAVDGKPADTEISMLRWLGASENGTRQLEQAAAGIAERLGVDAGKAEILARIDRLARELCYIEALRERCALLRVVAAKINVLAKLYRGDRTILDNISRVSTLLQRPYGEFEHAFDRLDAATSEILTVLLGIDDHVQQIRRARDDVHMRLMPWDDVIAIWTALDPVRGTETEAALDEFYRFAARHYLVQTEQRAGLL